MPHPPADWSRTLASPATVPSPADDDGRPQDASPPRRRRARLAAAAAILLAAAGAAIVALQSGSSRHPSPATGIPPGDTTTSVERRTLVERSQLDGTLTYSGSAEIYDRLSGTFTWLPSVGSTVRRGGTLFRVNDLPVVLMYGSLPAYRTLKQGVSDGSDVAELNTNLIALGYDADAAIGDRRHFGSATSAAVRRWQHAEGLSQTGEVELGRVVFAHSARRVTAVHVALGDDPPAAANGEEASKPKESSHPKENANPKESSKEKDGSPAQEEEKSKERERSKGAEKEAANEGGSGAAPKAVLGTTSTQQQVQLQVKADQQQLARVGEAAPVTLPDGRVVHAHVTDVGTVASESSEKEKEGANGNGGNGNGNGSGNGENATVSVTLALDHPVARLDKAPVSVELVKSIRRDVLAVGATALVATAGGGYAVWALVNDRRVALPVTPGMFANGYVEIEGAGVHRGLTVTEPR